MLAKGGNIALIVCDLVWLSNQCVRPEYNSLCKLTIWNEIPKMYTILIILTI